MSDAYIEAVTFPNHIIRPEDDGMVRQRLTANGLISNATTSVVTVEGVTYLKIEVGWFMLCGRTCFVPSGGIMLPIETNKNYVFLIGTILKNNPYATGCRLHLEYSDSAECPQLTKGYINVGSSDYTENFEYSDVLAAASRNNSTWSIYYQMKSLAPSLNRYSIKIEPSHWSQITGSTEWRAVMAFPSSHPDDTILTTYGKGYRNICLNNGIYGYENRFGVIEFRAASKPSSSVWMLVVNLGSDMFGHTTFNP